MPYTMKNKPDIIKNAPKKVQEIWIAAFNAAYKKNHNDEQSIKIAWSAVKNAGFKRNDDGFWRRWD
jgi:cation transport regulator ChaB